MLSQSVCCSWPGNQHRVCLQEHVHRREGRVSHLYILQPMPCLLPTVENRLGLVHGQLLNPRWLELRGVRCDARQRRTNILLPTQQRHRPVRHSGRCIAAYICERQHIDMTRPCTVGQCTEQRRCEENSRFNRTTIGITTPRIVCWWLISGVGSSRLS